MSETEMADNNRTSIYLSPRLIDEKAKYRESPFGGFSARLTNVLARIQFVTDNCRPKFTKQEWLGILDTLNGYFMADDMNGIVGIPFGLIDAIAVDALDEKWEFDANSFIAKVKELTSAELVSIAETADEFWRQQPGRDAHEFVEQLVREAEFKRPWIRPFPPQK